MPTRDFSEGITADFENSIVIYNVQVSGGYHKLQRNKRDLGGPSNGILS